MVCVMVKNNLTKIMNYCTPSFKSTLLIIQNILKQLKNQNHGSNS